MPIDFVAADFPQANRLTVHILAVVAEHEAAMISARTKAALDAGAERLGPKHHRGTAAQPANSRCRPITASKNHGSFLPSPELCDRTSSLPA
jgi:DNA invertase Pin-like site-specific DNA recombinase